MSKQETGPGYVQGGAGHAAQEEGSNLQDLASRLREVEGVDNDIAELIANNWQKLFGFLFLVLLGLYLYNEYREAKASQREETAYRFRESQKRFSAFLDSGDLGKDKGSQAAKVENADVDHSGHGHPDADAERIKKQFAFREGLDLIRSTYADSSYSDFSALYLAVADIEEGKNKEALALIEPFQPNSFDNVKEAQPRNTLDPERMVKEFSALLSARAMLADAGTGPAPDLVKSRLAGLAMAGMLLDAQALEVLYNISATEQDLAEVKRIAQDIVKIRPDRGESLKSRLQGLEF